MDLKEALDPGAIDVVRHPWELARYKVVRDLLREYGHINQSTSLRVLDMGCGDSWFVEQLAKDFPQHHYYGVDIAFSDDLLVQLNQRLASEPIDLFHSLADAAPGITEPVDIVLLLDVIEHIEDEIEFLQWMQTFSIIQPSTRFFITVPAYQSLFCQHDVFLAHYRRYTTQSAQTRLKEAHLQIEQQGYFFTSLLPPRALQVAKQRLNPPKPDAEEGVGQWRGGPTATQAFTQVLWRDYMFGKRLRKLGISLPGLSHFAIARPHGPAAS